MKIADLELIKQNKLGLSDRQIAHNFRMNRKSIWIRRIKLGLSANFQDFSGKNIDIKEYPVKARLEQDRINNRRNIRYLTDLRFKEHRLKQEYERYHNKCKETGD